MKERLTTWLYYSVAATPALLVLAFWVVPRVALQRFRRPVDDEESPPSKRSARPPKSEAAHQGFHKAA